MGSPALSILYLIVTIASVYTAIYYFTHTYEWSLFGYNLSFLVLLASIPYTTYMFFYELKGEEPLMNDVNVRSTNFMIDVYSKFLFSFAFAVLLFYFIYLFRINFQFPNEFSDWLVTLDVYVNLILPIFCLFDTFLITRNKLPFPVADLTIIFTIIFLHCAYRTISYAITYDTLKLVLPTIADYIVLFLMTVNGYIIYDYMIHKRNYPGEYMLFKV
jgi:hypothetical protein